MRPQGELLTTPDQRVRRRVSDALADLKRDFSRDELRELRDEETDRCLSQGRRIRGQLQRLIHKEMSPSDLDLNARRAWLPVAWTVHRDMREVRHVVSQGKR
jgi:hypothetical protein